MLVSGPPTLALLLRGLLVLARGRWLNEAIPMPAEILYSGIPKFRFLHHYESQRRNGHVIFDARKTTPGVGNYARFSNT